MAEVLFYHLQNQSLEAVLPTLLQKTLERDWRAVVQVTTEERMAALDDHLWTFTDESFLPHGTDREAHAADQPILITLSGDNPNGASIRFLVWGVMPIGSFLAGVLGGAHGARFVFWIAAAGAAILEVVRPALTLGAHRCSLSECGVQPTSSAISRPA